MLFPTMFFSRSLFHKALVASYIGETPRLSSLFRGKNYDIFKQPKQVFGNGKFVAAVPIPILLHYVP